jgi:hypothetical protein
MQIQRQIVNFGADTRQIDRATPARDGAFDRILARESAVRRQDLAATGFGRQNFGAPTPGPAGRADVTAGSSRLNGLNPSLISPFPVPSTPPTAPPASSMPPATPPAATPAPAAPRAAAPPAPQVTTERHPAMAALRSAMTALGMPFAGIDMEYSEQTVGYPGGSYVNRLITVRGADGRTENFDAEMTLKNPQIAAVDMANFMRGNV